MSSGADMERIVLVLGKNYSTPLGVIRSLGKAGYTVEMLYISRKVSEADILKSSRYLHRLVTVDEEKDEKAIDALTHAFDTEKYQYILFPTDDYSASLIDRFQAVLESRYLMPHVIGDSVTRLMDKSVQSRLARETGFRTAKEWTVSLSDTPVRIPEDIEFPCFIKPLISAKGGKLGISRCSDRKELKSHLAEMQRTDPDRYVIIQEYLNIIREYTIGGVCSDQQIYIPATIRKLQIAQYNRGITLSGELADNETIADCFDLVVSYLKKVRYVGMFDFEVLETDKGFYFGELNLRCGGPSYSYFLAGANLPATAVEVICGGKLDDGKAEIRLGRPFINNKVAWEDYSNLFMSEKQLQQIISEIPDSLLSDTDDPEPERTFSEMMPNRYRKHRHRQIIKKFIPKALLRFYLDAKQQKHQ